MPTVSKNLEPRRVTIGEFERIGLPLAAYELSEVEFEKLPINALRFRLRKNVFVLEQKVTCTEWAEVGVCQ